MDIFNILLLKTKFNKNLINYLIVNKKDIPVHLKYRQSCLALSKSKAVRLDSPWKSLKKKEVDRRVWKTILYSKDEGEACN